MFIQNAVLIVMGLLASGAVSADETVLSEIINPMINPNVACEGNMKSVAIDATVDGFHFEGTHALEFDSAESCQEFNPEDSFPAEGSFLKRKTSDFVRTNIYSNEKLTTDGETLTVFGAAPGDRTVDLLNVRRKHYNSAGALNSDATYYTNSPLALSGLQKDGSLKLAGQVLRRDNLRNLTSSIFINVAFEDSSCPCPTSGAINVGRITTEFLSQCGSVKITQAPLFKWGSPKVSYKQLACE